MTKTYHVYITVHPESTVDVSLFRAIAAPLLQSPSGWRKQGYHFIIVNDLGHSPPSNLITITLTPQSVLDSKFPDFSNSRLSVCNMATREVFINEQRWLRHYADDHSDLELPAYRMYVIQHEVGHALGFDHDTCKGKGEKAPVMLQQTLGHGDCLPWPFPT
jgi:hypothetical protein